MKLMFLMWAMSPTDQGIMEAVILRDYTSETACEMAKMVANTMLYEDEPDHLFCVTVEELMALRDGDVLG